MQFKKTAIALFILVTTSMAVFYLSSSDILNRSPSQEELHSSNPSSSMDIHFFNRQTQKLETEKVMGNHLIQWAYQTQFGYFITDHLLKYRFFSKIMGSLKNLKSSRKQIQTFIKDYQINMDDFVSKDYSSFNDFFIREYKPGKRPFDLNAKVISAGAEARYLLIDSLQLNHTFNIKGIDVNLEELFGQPQLAQQFVGGSLLIARLCPTDYHRFHFPLDSEYLDSYRIKGEYHSVNPIALKRKPDILLKNERHITLLKNAQIGTYAMVEVGAFAVGKIVQTQNEGHKGDQKGYFLFGGSTVVFIFPKSANLHFEKDLIEYSQQGIETWIPLGGTLATLE